MTMHPPGEHAGAPGFDALMAEATAATGRFGHRLLALVEDNTKSYNPKS